MFESFGFETVTAPQAAVWFGVVLGLLFGALAEVSRFCLRRALVGPAEERRSAAGVWLAALAAAVLGTQAAVVAGLVSFDDHRLLAGDLPVAAILAGGLMFGAGMVLTRGCASRMTVLLGTGNLRALSVLLVFGVTAHATLKGVLAPVRTTLGEWTLPLGEAASLAALPGGGVVWASLIGLGALAVALRSGSSWGGLAAGVAIGLLVPAGWVGTGFVLYDDFDPIALQSLSFTAPHADTLFWGIASTSIPASFGVGLVGGTIGGAFVAALLGQRLRWQSFASPAETGRYLTGGALMGVGGVLAGGCTVGAGLAGIPTLSVAAALALFAIALGALVTSRLLQHGPSGLAVAAE